MPSSYLFALQIIITVFLVILILFQRSNNDGIVNTRSDSHLPTTSQISFINKTTIFFIILFMGNSLFLAKQSIDQYKQDSKIIESLKGKSQLSKEEDPLLIPKME